jgi:hypothetical protein
VSYWAELCFAVRVNRFARSLPYRLRLLVIISRNY